MHEQNHAAASKGMDMKTSPLVILHLEDNEIDADYMAAMLSEEGLECDILRAARRSEFLELLQSRRFDLIVSDYSMPSFDGGEALNHARRLAPDTPFMFVSGTIGEEAAVESLKGGAVDYVLKSRMSRFPAAVRRAVEEASKRAERAALQREIIKREELFRQITDNVDDLIAVLDLQGRRVFSSPSYRKILGEPQALDGTDSFSDIHPEDQDRIRKIFSETVASGVGQRAEYRLIGRDGNIRTIESQGSVVRDSHRVVTNVVVVSRDVTDARRMDERLRQQAALLDQARDAIFVRDLDQKVTYWNQGAERLYGWRSEEMIGRRASEVLYREGFSLRSPAWSELIDQGGWSGELRQMTKDGRDVTVISRRTLLRNDRGEPVAVMNINSDVTERKEMEEKLLRSQRLEAIGSLAGGIAHDLNNILSPILMLADLMYDVSVDASERSMLQTVKNSAMRGADLVKQILSFAHGTSNRPMNLQVRHLIKDMVALMKDTFPRSIKIEHDVARDLCAVRGDPTQLHQVILNLCVNARDAMPEGGRLCIAAHNVVNHGETGSSPRIEIVVSDTGCGIPLSIREKIFRPFFTTKETGKGTGLGLSTVASIVKDHGGSVELESEPGRGTTFKVRLPAAPESRPVPEHAVDIPPPKGRGQRILLVDDEQAVLTMSMGVLQAYDYHVTVAVDGLEALALHRRQAEPFDLVITDNMMPGMDGLTLMRHLNRVAPKLKVIVISGMAEAAPMNSESPNLAATLRKPYEGSELLRVVGEVLAG